VQLALVAEVAPPLEADRPRVPHERGAGVDADQERRRLGEILPALHLHPEPVVDERVPDELLTLDEVQVLGLEVPVAGALGDPAGGALRLLAALVRLAGGLLGVALGLRFRLRLSHTNALPGAAVG
jgi:hypothetical protein